MRNNCTLTIHFSWLHPSPGHTRKCHLGMSLPAQPYGGAAQMHGAVPRGQSQATPTFQLQRGAWQLDSTRQISLCKEWRHPYARDIHRCLKGMHVEKSAARANDTPMCKPCDFALITIDKGAYILVSHCDQSSTEFIRLEALACSSILCSAIRLCRVNDGCIVADQVRHGRVSCRS